jgi:hypothetical protein
MNSANVPIRLPDNSSYTISFMDLTNHIWIQLVRISMQNDTTDPWGQPNTGWLDWKPTNIRMNVSSNRMNQFSVMIQQLNSVNDPNNHSIVQLFIGEPCNTISNIAFYHAMIVVPHRNQKCPVNMLP